ncbi:MAG: hypothetical protein ACI9FJ_002202, partial [Alteromonadaceae bacterium]
TSFLDIFDTPSLTGTIYSIALFTNIIYSIVGSCA